MSYGRMNQAYRETEQKILAEINDPHAIILTMFNELLKSMQLFCDCEKTSKLRAKYFARALTIIYSLQSGLDFEKGGEIAPNLFQLYEYARQQLLSDIHSTDTQATRAAHSALCEIRDAWQQIGIMDKGHPYA